MPPEPIAIIALDDVEALAERVGGRVEQRADAVLLVVAQHRPLDVGLADAVLGDDDRGDRAAAPITSTGTISFHDRPAKKIT